MPKLPIKELKSQYEERPFTWDKELLGLHQKYEFPKIKFPTEWQIEIIPNFSGACYRFLVYYNSKVVSVYFDTHSQLGSMSEPYFEIYLLGQEKHKAPKRYLSDQTKKMINQIKKWLN